MRNIVYLIICIFIYLTLGACSNQMNKALRSEDKEYMLKIAEQYYNNKKYKNALTIYERLTKYVVGSKEAAIVSFKTAYANYYDRNYILAAHQFKNYSNSYIRESNREEAAYMAVKSYYSASPDYNLDQRNTVDAINEIQSFIDIFPDSEYIKECNELMNELNYKLQKKAFENAKTLYKIMEYKASIVSFENMLDDFPDTSIKEEIMMYIVRADAELAINSIYKLKAERIEEAKRDYGRLLRNFPETKYKSELDKIKNSLDKSYQEYEAGLKKVKKEVSK